MSVLDAADFSIKRSIKCAGPTQESKMVETNFSSCAATCRKNPEYVFLNVIYHDYYYFYRYCTLMISIIISFIIVQGALETCVYLCSLPHLRYDCIFIVSLFNIIFVSIARFSYQLIVHIVFAINFSLLHLIY